MGLGLLRFVFVVILMAGSIPRKSDGAAAGEWCIANEKAPVETIQKGLDWACQNGADCGKIQANQPCYMPNTVKDHASFAFNSYFQKTKHNGGNCFFNGAAITTPIDPSKDSCKFELLP